MVLGRRKGKVYDVEHKPRGNSSKPWAVSVNGRTTVSRHRKKSAAERKAKRLAKNNRPSQLNIYNKNGAFSRGREYD